MGIAMNERYMICNLEKHECDECGKEFIVATEMLNGTPHCPYCGGKCTEKIAWTEDDNLEDLDIGCLGISIEKIKGVAISIAQ